MFVDLWQFDRPEVTLCGRGTVNIQLPLSYFGAKESSHNDTFQNCVACSGLSRSAPYHVCDVNYPTVTSNT